MAHVGGCQNCDPFLGMLNRRGIIIGNQNRSTILTTNYVDMHLSCQERARTAQVWEVGASGRDPETILTRNCSQFSV